MHRSSRARSTSARALIALVVVAVTSAGLGFVASAPTSASPPPRVAAAAASETICTDTTLPRYTMTAIKVKETDIPTYHQDWPGGTVAWGLPGCQVTITRPSGHITTTEVGGDPWRVAVAAGSGFSSAALGTVHSPNCTAPLAISRVAGNRPSCSAGLITTQPASTAGLTVTVVPNPVLNVTVSGSGLGTVTSNVPGINCGADCVQQYGLNTEVTLTAVPAAGSTLDSWTGAPGCGGASLTCKVTMSQSRQVSAVFVADGVNSLTVVKGGTGTGTVTSNPSGINCGTTCASTFTSGLQVVLTATPSADSTFVGWAGQCSGTAACVVTMDGNRTVVANFALKPVPTQLTITKNGTGAGTVRSTPTGIDCGATCQGTFDSGSTIELQAVPAPGSLFTGWSSGGCTGTAACTVNLNDATTVFATFTAITHRPDALIGAGSGAPVGDGVYSSTAAGQAKAVNAKRGGTAVFRVPVQNDGSVADTFGLRQKAGTTKGFQVAYLLGGKDITRSVVAGTFKKAVARAGSFVVTVKVKVARTAKVRSVQQYLITAVSKADGTKKDAVRAIVTAR